MATLTINGLQASGPGGSWTTYYSDYTRGHSYYVDEPSSGCGCKTRVKISVTPTANHKITSITLGVSFARNGACALFAKMFSTQPTATTSMQSGTPLASAAWPSGAASYINNPTSSSVPTSNPTSSGTVQNFTFSGLNITGSSATTLYIWFYANSFSGGLIQIYDYTSANCRAMTITASEAALTSTISYNGNGYTGGTLPGSGSYTIGSSYTVSSNTLTHSDTNGYVISFNSNGGGTAPSAITQKIGWTHDYWALNGTGGTRYNKGASFTVPSSASTFYAHWATTRKAITLPAAPSAPTGKYFTGWYTASSGGSKAGNAGASWTPDTTRTLYAQWAWNTYTVKYNGNGNTGGTVPGNQTKTYGTNLTLSSNNLTKSNTSLTGFTVTFDKNTGNNLSVASVTNTRSTSYSHNGWRFNSTSGTLYSKGGTYSTNAAATFYASWATTTNNGQVTTATCTKNSTTSNCTVSFNATTNGGSCSTPSLTSSRTTTYTCTGWWTATSGGTRRATSGGKYTPTASETVHAQWSSSTGAYSAITLPTATKTGYTFVGWSTSSTATSGTTGSYTPTGNVTLYAIFSQNTYTLTVYKNGVYQGNGTSNETFSLAYNATKNFHDGYRANHGWGGWYWSGSYTWKNFGATTYCATVWSDGQRRTGSWQLFSDIQLHTYNNAGNSTRPVTTSYVADSNSGTNYVFQLAFSASSSGSAYGFYGPVLNGSTLKNTRWVHVFRAKIPAAYYLVPTANSMGGANNEIHWLTDNKGTGGYKDYAYERRFGTLETPSTSAFPYVSLSTEPYTLNVPKVAVTIQVAFSIVYRGAEYAINRTLTMANSNMGILAQAYEPIFWTYQLLNGGSSTLATKTYHNFGTAYTIPAPTRTNYTFTNWTRIYATNIFKETWRYINNTSGNTYTTFKIQLFTYTGTYVKNIANNSNTSVYGTWTCDVDSGVYWIKYGMNGSTADNARFERMWLDNGAVYGYYWERVNTTSGQDITINNFIFGRSGSTTTTSYPTTSNYSLYLKANWTANASIHINANGGWLNPAGYDSGFTNDTVTPLGRVNYSGSVYTHSLAYGSSADLADWNNPGWLNLMRLGYSVPTGEQYYNSAGTLFEHNTAYTAQTYVPALTSSSPAEGDVYVNWQPNDYTFTLQRQDTTIASSVVENYGQIAQLPEDHKDYYTFMGWFKEFTGADFVQFGRDYMYTDKIAIHLTAYRDDWSTFDNGMKLISCTEGGGWNIEGGDNYTRASGYESSVGYNVSPNLSIGIKQLSSGFHDFDIVFTGTQYQFWIDDQYAGATTWSHPIGYYVTTNSCNQILVGKEASSFTSSRPQAAEPTAPAFIGYIGNVVIAHQNTRIDATAARTQWSTPVENITLKSLFRENPYIKVHLNIGNGVVVDGNNNVYHNEDIIKFYYEDNQQKTFTCYPPTAQMITSLTTRNDLTDIITNAITTGTATTTSYTDGELSMNFTAVGNANAHADIYLSMTYADLPVLRYQHLLVDNNSNNIVDNNGNNIKVTVKYIPYRHNGSTWQRCEPRGYSNGWKLGG